jgi:hypothetical protein
LRDDDKTAFVLLLLTLSFVAGWVGHSIRERKIVMKLADATLPYPVSPSCVPPDEQERAVLSIAASISDIPMMTDRERAASSVRRMIHRP